MKRVAINKQQALTYRSEQINFGYESGLIETVQWFLHDIGAEKHLSDNDSDRLKELKRFHEKLSVDNYAFPEDIPFHLIYPKFFTAVVNNSVERRGNNVSEIIRVFRQWIALPNQMEKLREEYRDEYPDEQPKALPKRVVHDDPLSAEWIDGLPVEKQPDEVVEDQCQKILFVMNDDHFSEWLESLGGKGYIKRMMDEGRKRGFVNGEV